jgi:hypothetical protein
VRSQPQIFCFGSSALLLQPRTRAEVASIPGDRETHPPPLSLAHEAIFMLSISVAYWRFLRGIGNAFVQQSETDVSRYMIELSYQQIMPYQKLFLLSTEIPAKSEGRLGVWSKSSPHFGHSKFGNSALPFHLLDVSFRASCSWPSGQKGFSMNRCLLWQRSRKRVFKHYAPPTRTLTGELFEEFIMRQVFA